MGGFVAGFDNDGVGMRGNWCFWGSEGGGIGRMCVVEAEWLAVWVKCWEMRISMEIS